MDMAFLGGDPLGGDPLGGDGFGGDASGDADRVSVDHDGSFAAQQHVSHLIPSDIPSDDLGGTSSPEDHLWMHSDGRVWDLGPADVDTDDDGVRDSLTRSGAGGMTVYTDSDHDGQVDKITEIDAQGMFSSRTLDPESGAWVPTDTGRLG
ncbi:DUF6802 family protein [Gordonia hankookensis]|uniref:DUF6802 domain-containing protein n=1 Tax=Gordonia hankookensis TaxID=589403 RepID=A0ABR7WBG7_9ACTN|nr:DUF6802 family protein [Gordonia hankookensis]MBD1319950.1 hypothetical protein [Gordonia hankookensis]